MKVEAYMCAKCKRILDERVPPYWIVVGISELDNQRNFIKVPVCKECLQRIAAGIE